MRRRRLARVWLALAALLAAAPVRTLWAEPRAAKVAGQFYPGDAEQLRAAVSQLLAPLPAPSADRPPRILISPHAGYAFSGPIAAAAFRQVSGRAFDGVVVVGFTHQMRFDGASVDDREAYVTPLGAIPVNTDAVAMLRSRPGITRQEDAHASGEHSLEVMLPFLQSTLGEFRLVPILMGSDAPEDAERLADALAALAATGNYLFVFSTDLSHFHPYDEAVRIDERTVNALLHETAAATGRLFAANRLEACGRGPILAALVLAERLGYLDRRLLAYANSGDTTGDKQRVVGYAAVAMYERAASASTPALSREAGMALVRAARATIESHLRKTERPDLQLDTPELQATRGLFVTLRRGGELRGCIGRIVADQPLSRLLPIVALEAALNDHRFTPVTAEELDQLHVEVSILSPPTPVAHPSDLVAGRDGVVLQRDGHSGVFLPQVWDDTGWTRVEFLRELASQKAGLEPDAWQQAQLLTFQDQIFAEPDAPH